MRAVNLIRFAGAAVLALSWTTTNSLGQPSDLVIRGAQVLQCNTDMDLSSAVAVRDGHIVYVGETGQLDGWIGESTVVVDAEGNTLIPGLIDSHLHFAGLGHALQILDLNEAPSWAAIVEQVTRAARVLPPGTWIEGRGWHQSKFVTPADQQVDGYPHHRQLSAAVPDHPVLLTHASGHAVFANQAAMQRAGVKAETSDPLGGEILKDDQGMPLGVFRENAARMITRAMARDTRPRNQEDQLDRLRKEVQLAGQACLRYGITSVHDAGSSFATVDQLAQLAAEGQLPVRLYVMVREGPAALRARLPQARLAGVGDGFLTVRSVKVSIDGALGPHGAWLLRPYADLPQSSGLNTIPIDDLVEIAHLCRQHQWQLCVHAIGDRANREVLDAFESGLGDQVQSDHRWRIEHAQHLSVEDIPRFGRLGVIPAMQANHCTSDAIFVPRRLGERRSAEGAYVWRSLIDSGAIIPNGTDAPVESVDPRVSLFAAVTRQLGNGQQFYPEQCMTRREALLSYTLWPAQASFQESEVGSLEVGKRADFAMWDTNLLNCAPEEILDANVLRIWLGGQEIQLEQ